VTPPAARAEYLTKSRREMDLEFPVECFFECMECF
jgi:hypothetical protein